MTDTNVSKECKEEFRVNAKIRQEIDRRKRRRIRRLSREQWQEPDSLGSANIDYELSERATATSAGGIGVICELARQLGLAETLNQRVPVMTLYAPYSDADHIQNIAFNLLAGGRCLEHIEHLRQDEAYLNGVGVERIPDPTTAGDYCRRYTPTSIHWLMDAINEIRVKVWQTQPAGFFDKAIIEVDGVMVETYGRCKQGIDINYKKQWGYHPLIVSLANTREPLFIVNRPGNRPSHEGASEYIDRAIEVCRKGGFKEIVVRGDTDFTQTRHLDRWNREGVVFVFGIDAMQNLYDEAEKIDDSEWEELERLAREIKTRPRRKKPRYKERIVRERGYKNITLEREWVGEFNYKPGKCKEKYRVVVVWKELTVSEGQPLLFKEESRCFFYITNNRDDSAEEIVRQARARCNQENTVIQQLKGDVRALAAPLDTLISNWAYMVIASLAWSLKVWCALMLPAKGRWRKNRFQEKERLLRMEFSTFRNVLMRIPAQIIRTGRRVVYRVLAVNEWSPTLFRMHEAFRRPLRC